MDRSGLQRWSVGVSTAPSPVVACVRLTDDEGDLFAIGYTIVGPPDELQQLVKLFLPPPVMIDAHVESEAPAAQHLDALNKVLGQHGPIRLILQQIAEPLDLGPRVPGHLLRLLQIPLHGICALRHGRPRHNAQAHLRILGRRVVAVARLAERHAPQVVQLRQLVSPVIRAAVLAVDLDEDVAQQGRRGLGGGLVLSDGVGAAQGVVGRGPGVPVDVALGVEVDVGVDDGEEELLLLLRGRHCERLQCLIRDSRLGMATQVAYVGRRCWKWSAVVVGEA